MTGVKRKYDISWNGKDLNPQPACRPVSSELLIHTDAKPSAASLYSMNTVQDAFPLHVTHSQALFFYSPDRKGTYFPLVSYQLMFLARQSIM